MSIDKTPSDDYISKWSNDGIDMLYEFMQTEQLSLQTVNPRDPFLLAQNYQRTIDATDSPDFRDIMGAEGERSLNESASKNFVYQRLAILTDRLFVIETIEDTEFVTVDYDKNVLVTGMFAAFQYGHSDDRDRLAVQLTNPSFLRPRLDVESELFARANRFLVPVDAIAARLYDPEELIN